MPTIRLPRWLGVLLIIGVSVPGSQARPVPPDSARTVSTERMIGYSFANDAPFRTDYYFTQGMSLTVVLPAFARLPSRYLLVSGSRYPGISTYGVRIHYDGFTPLRIQDPFIRRGDRPYASYVYASLFQARTDRAYRHRLTTNLQVGFIGPAAGAKGFQTTIHHLIDAPVPRGWDFQVRNDLVLGYQVSYEQLLIRGGHALELLSTTTATLSTLRTHATTGLMVRAGRQSQYLRTLAGVVKGGGAVDVFIEGRAEGRLVGYDATLQGGLLNHASPYTLAPGAIRRVVGLASVALGTAYHGVSARAVATQLTPELRGGRPHAWGQLDLRAAF